MNKTILNYLKPSVELKERSDDGKRRVVVTISTNSPDRSNDIVDPKGAILDNYIKNPVVLYGHNYRGFPVANSENTVVRENDIISTAVFPAEGEDADIDKVYRLIKLGLINAASIGFYPKEWTERKDENGWGYTFNKWELLEWSFVPVPDNQDALILMRSAGVSDEQAEELREFLKKGAKKLDTEQEEEEEHEEEEQEETKSIEELTKTITDLTAENTLLKEGRVLSDANRKLINTSVEQLKEAITVMEQLLEATIKEDEDKEDKKDADQPVTNEYLKKVYNSMKKQDKSIGLTLRQIKQALDVGGGEK